MVAPLALGLMLGSSAITGVYHVGKAYETERYWDDYRRNTHRSPRYPYRIGRYSYIGDIGSLMTGTAGMYSMVYRAPVKPRVVNSHFDYREYRRR